MGASRFEGRTAVVTGAGHGIGRATARRLAAEGAQVAVWDIRGDLAEQTVRHCADAGGRAVAYPVDVSDETQVAAAAEAVHDDLGTVDILHNNAGVLRTGSVLDMELADWDVVMNTNLRGTVLVTRALLPDMLDAGRGAIVNTASVSGLVGDEGLTAYDVSKGAIIQFTRQLTADYAPRGIRPNCVCPGWVKTGFNDPQFDADPDLDEEELVRLTTPMQRQARPEEIASVVAFLASDDASYVAGHILVVDGGMIAA